MITKLEENISQRKDGRCNFLEIRINKLYSHICLWLMALLLIHSFKNLVTKTSTYSIYVAFKVR